MWGGGGVSGIGICLSFYPAFLICDLVVRGLLIRIRINRLECSDTFVFYLCVQCLLTSVLFTDSELMFSNVPFTAK